MKALRKLSGKLWDKFDEDADDKDEE